jgi:hypothetical protein
MRHKELFIGIDVAKDVLDVAVRRLAWEAWIMDDPSCSVYLLTVDLCHAAGLEPNVVANHGVANTESPLNQFNLRAR